MQQELAQKKCIPCQGGVPPMDEASARSYLADRPAWQLSADVKKIERTFRFSDFAEALAFVNDVGRVAEDENHHPDIHFGWGYVTITVQTHKIDGLHENDFILAAKIDALTGT